MPPSDPASSSLHSLKRTVMMTILALAWVSSGLAWAVVESTGKSSTALRIIFGLNAVFHPATFVIAWRRWRPQQFVDLACLLFATILCALCMALRLYSPYGAEIDIQPLYLWIPMIYVFVFTLARDRSSLRISLGMLLLFFAISLPYLLGPGEPTYRNFTIQLHAVSAVLIAALYFFSSYQHRFYNAQLTVDELARLANTDELTQLANRRRVTEMLVAELARFGRYGQVFSVILIDVDHFKTINDRDGHEAGDRTLVALGARAAPMLRDVDMLGRWGGEEFIVILPQTGFDETLRKASALCALIASAPLVAPHLTTVSCGVTSVAPGDSVDSLLRRADRALYAAKDAGRNRTEGLPADTSSAVPDPDPAAQPAPDRGKAP